MIRQRKLPFQPGIQSVALSSTEDEVQSSIVQALTLLGYTVLVTSERRKGCRCPSCSHWFRPSGGRGTSQGIPDLLITRKGWGNRWVGIECKGTHTRVSEHQRLLADEGHIDIARSIEDAIAAIERV